MIDGVIKTNWLPIDVTLVRAVIEFLINQLKSIKSKVKSILPKVKSVQGAIHIVQGKPYRSEVTA